jgi:hypothetical protein
LKHSPAQAYEFWEGIALDDGLRRGDPRKTFLIYIDNNDFKSRRNGVMVAGIPWNHFYTGEKLAQIKLTDATQIKILGTPLDGRRK